MAWNKTGRRGQKMERAWKKGEWGIEGKEKNLNRVAEKAERVRGGGKGRRPKERLV